MSQRNLHIFIAAEKRVAFKYISVKTGGVVQTKGDWVKSRREKRNYGWGEGRRETKKIKKNSFSVTKN